MIDTITIGDSQLRVPLPALEWLWEAEARGLDLRLDDGDTLVVEPDRALTRRDREVLREHGAILALVVWWCTAEDRFDGVFS